MWQKKIFASAAILVLALMVAFPAVGLLAGESTTDATDLSTTGSGVLEAYGKLPLLFVQNQGQMDEAVRYYVRASGQTVYFTEENIVFDLVRSDGAESDDTADRQAERLVFSLDFLGANSQPVIEGSGKDGAVVNYFVGNDPEQWHANVPTYGELVYRDIYPNVDLRLYDNGGMLRYDFVVNPGATPEDIALAYNGIDSLTIIGGELVIGTAFGDTAQSQPHIYQQIGDEVVEVEGGFRLGSDNTYGFHVAAYNNHYPLIIDPVMLDYSTYLGDAELWNTIAVDRTGCVYVTGQTYYSDFPTSPGAYQPSYAGSSDAFVVKLSLAGGGLTDRVYSTYLGGGDGDRGWDIAVDANGCAYVTGETASSDFPTSPGAYQTSNAGFENAFVTKLSANGATLEYSTYLGGNSSDSGWGIAVDSNGYVYVTGTTSSPDFPTSPGAYQSSNAGEFDAFVVKLLPTGNGTNDLVYSTYLGGGNCDGSEGIALDTSGYVYVHGDTTSSDFPTSPGAYQSSNAGEIDAFVTKLSPAGDGLTDLMYSTYLGGEGSEVGEDIAVDTSGCAYVTGNTASSNFPTTTGALQPLHGGNGELNDDAFVTKLSPTGTSLVYSTYLGGNSDDNAEGIAVDTSGYVYVTGGTRSSDFPTKYAYQNSLSGLLDAFVTKLSLAGGGLTDLAYSTYLGGTGEDDGEHIAVDSNGCAYITGETTSSDFPTTSGAYLGYLYGGQENAFVTKLSLSSPCFIATAAYGTPMAEEVEILREFRDEYLLTNPLGQAFVDFYYRISPPIAEFITEHPSLKPIVRAGLVPAVAMSTVAVNTTLAEKMVIIGLVVLVSVALAIWVMRWRGIGPEYT